MFQAFTSALIDADIPRNRETGAHPSKVTEASSPSSKCENAKPEENPSLNPVRQAGKDTMPLLLNVSYAAILWVRFRPTKKRPKVMMPRHSVMKPKIRIVRSMKLYPNIMNLQTLEDMSPPILLASL